MARERRSAAKHGRAHASARVGGASRSALALLSFAAASCTVEGPNTTRALADAVIYGTDDRVEAFAAAPVFRELATTSAVALVPEAQLRIDADGSVEFTARPLAEIFQLCASEPFGEQPSLAECSGVLIAPDLLLTAAHCLDEQWPCERQVWAFGFAWSAPDLPPQFHSEDLYRCRTIAARRYERTFDDRVFDYAVVQLDRPVSGARRPASLSREVFEPGERLTVIGYPDGIPVKVDSGAELLDVRAATQDYLSLTSDTFSSSSGSGVFDTAGRLVAVLARGSADYEYDTANTCYRARHVTVPIEPALAEQASFVAPAIEQLCNSGWASSTLCDRASQCGDGQCSVDEYDGPCRADCPAIPRVGSRRPPDAPGCAIAPARAGWVTPPSMVVLALFVVLRRSARRARLRTAAKNRSFRSFTNWNRFQSW